MRRHRNERTEPLVRDQILHHGVTLGRGNNGQCRKDENRTNQNHTQIVTAFLAPTPRTTHLPDSVERVFNLADQRDHGIEQQRHPDRAQHTDPQITHKLQDASGNFGALLTQRLQGLSQ